MQKILVIDENPEETEFLEAVLEEEYEITDIHTAKEGLARAETGEYALIFLDMSLADIEELSFFKKLQEKVMPWHVPIILLTDRKDVKKGEKGLMLGAADYIERPFYPMAVKVKAHTHISLYRYRKNEEAQSAMVDPLTGVAGRQHYELNRTLKWQEAVRLNIPVSICILDIDRFRTYNERYGYPAGDKALISVAEAASSRLRRGTDFFARYGGEEFVAVILGGEGDAVFEHFKNIRQAVEKLHILHWDSASGWLTVSAGGVTVVPRHIDSYDTYFKIAQDMLSKAKNSGRNQVIWMSEKMEEIRER